MNRIYLIVAVAAVAMLSGCAASHPTITPRGKLPARFPNHSASEIRRLVQAGTDTLSSYRASAQMAVHSPERSGSFSADMYHRRRDTLRLSLSPGLGIEAARALVTPDSFFVYDRIRSRLAYGSRQDLPTNLPSVLASGDLFATLVGVTAPPSSWRTTTDSTYYQLHSPQGRRTYVVDPARWRVVRYVARDEQGRITEEHRFSRFERVGHLLLPTRLTFRRPLEHRSVVLTYRKRAFNPASLSLEMTIPSSASRHRVQ